MQIVEISEPGKNYIEDEIVVGIDFGTTNSLIAISKNHKPEVINGLVPSVIFYDEVNDKFVIGQNRSQKGSISSVKRLLAKTYQEIKSNDSLNEILTGLAVTGSDIPKILFNEKKYSLPELASKIFVHLKESAEQKLGKPVAKAAVSVPAYFDDASRGAVLLAAKIAGFEVLRLIAEPTAAAYAYGFHKKAEGSYMVYDLGGGTFDVSILNMQDGILQVISTGGDNLLGGDDIDYILAAHLAKERKIQITNELIAEAKKIKEELGGAQKLPRNVDIEPQLFQQLITPLIDKTIKIAKDTLYEANLDLDGIILVGGSTRIALVHQKLSEAFNTKIFDDIDPDKAVVIGASLQAENLSTSSNKNSLLIDVLPLSVGLELYGGITEKIIMRNTPIPFSVTKNFTTHVDNQTGMKFHIVQGEREMVKDCRSLAHFELKNIPSMKAGMAKIEVTFAVDADGILSITAREVTSGSTQNIDIKPSYGMSQQEVNDLLESAFTNAKQDYNTRLLVESKLDAQNMIFGINKAIKETPDILSEYEKKEILGAINSLQKAINSDNRDKILLKTQQLNKSAARFIQKHLDKGAEVLLKGRHVNDYM
jgi:molecular chaperone HscA